MATWHVERWGLWWTIGHALHWNVLGKILTMIWGTWELNLGPNDCKPRLQPLHHHVAFVNIMSNKYNICKIITMLETMKNARRFESTNHTSTRHLLLRFTCRNIKQIAGVLNPHKLEKRKIAISVAGYIKRARWLGWIRLALTNSTMHVSRSNFSVCKKPQNPSFETLRFFNGGFRFRMLQSNWIIPIASGGSY